MKQIKISGSPPTVGFGKLETKPVPKTPTVSKQPKAPVTMVSKMRAARNKAILK